MDHSAHVYYVFSTNGCKKSSFDFINWYVINVDIFQLFFIDIFKSQISWV